MNRKMTQAGGELTFWLMRQAARTITSLLLAHRRCSMRRWGPVLGVLAWGVITLQAQSPASGARLVVNGNDGGAIQEAIDALPGEGGDVLVRAGTYICQSPIVLDRDNVALRGEGPATVLVLADGANSPVIIMGQAINDPTLTRTNIRVSDFFIDGNRARQTSELWDRVPYIRNNGIAVRRVNDVFVDRVTVKSARSGGLVTERVCRRVTVRNFTAFDSEFDGLAGYETEDSLFSNLHLYRNTAAGLSFDLRFSRNVIRDSVLEANRTYGVFMRDSISNRFENLTVRDSGLDGIFVAQVNEEDTKAAIGNVFERMIVTGSAGAGIRINDAACVGNRVDDSQFAANTGGDIREPEGQPKALE